MSRREETFERLARDAKIGVGFGTGVSFQHGLVVKDEGIDGSINPGGKGLVIPWMGCKHLTVGMGAE